MEIGKNYASSRMRSQSRRDIVVFLGAGFSVDAGLPIMSNFGKESQIDFNTLKKHAERNEKYAAKMLVEAGTAFYAFQKLCRQSSTITDNDANNLETVFCIAEAMNEAGPEEISLEDQHYVLDELIGKIQLWIWKIYQQCPLLNPNRTTHKHTYEDFFALLKESNIWDRITVISTNYDLIFEYMAWKNCLRCAYPFKEGSDDVKIINAGYGSTPYIYLTEHNHEEHALMCKLHGSVNYFEDTSQSNTHILYVATDLGDENPIGKSFNFQNKPAIFAVDAIWKIRHDYGKSLTPAIIPPSYSKLRRKQWLRTAWRSAFDAIRAANTILFIGYSLPLTDGFLRALIHGALATRMATDKRNVFVIDPSSEVHENYYRLFGADYRDIGYHTLEYALKTNELKKVLMAVI